MQITVDNTKVDLHFGVRFVRELDKIAGIRAQAGGQTISLGFGLIKTIPALKAYDASALSMVLYAASYEAVKRPSLENCDSYLESLDINTLEKLFSAVEEELEKSTVVQLSVKNATA